MSNSRYMNRRNAIRTALIFSAGTALLPSCLQKDKATIPLKNISITGGQENMLAQLADTILPKTNFIGAADVKAHEFLLMMVDDCLPPERQKIFTNGLQQFDKWVDKKYGNSFANCTPQQKAACLTEVENKKEVPDEAVQFYQISKQHILQAFTSSKQYMLQVRHYNMVPGPNYKGCVAVSKVA